MVIGFWISLFIFIISVIMLVIKRTELYYYLEFYEKMIFGFLIGISLFSMIFCAYYGDMFV